MADTSSLSGVGSGIDTTSLVSGLVSADSGRLNALKAKQTSTNSAISTLSDISSALSTLQNAVTALSTAGGAGSFAGSSSSSAIAISTSGNAQPGSYSMNVTQLAKAQRTYSTAYASASSALGQSGTLSIQVGTGAAATINITDSDTLDQVAAKINGAGTRATAAVFYDGSAYRLQVSGLDTGKDNAISFGESGLNLGLNVAANTVQKAQNSIVNIDGFDVQRSTNQVVGAIQGVTLALTATTSAPVDVSIAADSGGLATKIQAVVSAYNSVLSKINVAAGKGSTPAGNSVLASDSTLRGITNRLSSVLQTVTGSGTYNSLGSIGLSLQRDGTLALDTTKLKAAVSADPNAVTALLAGSSGSSGGSGGVMGTLSDAIKTYNQAGTGLLTMHQTDLQNRVSDMTDSVNREQDRLDRYQALLQKQFAAMDTAVTANNSDMSYLSKLYSSG
jgi:flagellar hook-associated protein 2